MAAHAPSAMLRSRVLVKVVVRTESAAGDIIAAPIPCASRAATSSPSALRSAADERGEREQDEPADEDAAAADEVCGAPAEQQEAAVGEHVAADDPLQALLREAAARA